MSTDDDLGGDRAERVGLVDRLLPPVDQNGHDGLPKPSRMTPTEQWVGALLGVANVAVSAGVASVVTTNQALILLAGLGATALILAGARLGNRLLALTGMFASTLVSGQIFFALAMPYYAGAFWIFLKYNRLVKQQASLRRQQRNDQRGSAPAGSRPGRKPAQPGRGKGPSAKSSGRTAPPKSKRYTPPKPPKKRPPPPSKPPRDRSIVD